MHFKALADGFEQSDREPAAEVFPKFFEAFEHHQLIVGIDVEQFIGKQLEAQFFQKI